MSTRRRLIATWLAALLVCLAAPLGFILTCAGLNAQDTPARSITIVVPWPVGGLSMRVAETLAPALSRVLGSPVQVTSRPGESGFLGTRELVRAAPDGYTLLLGPSSLFVFDPSVIPDAGYVPERDLDALMMVLRAPAVLVIHPTIPARTLPDLIAYLKAHPRTVRFGASGGASVSDLLAAEFWAETGTDGLMAYFQGADPLLPALISGSVQAAFMDVSTAAAAVRNGQVRALAVTGETRTRVLPEVGSFAEQGIADIDAYTWQAVAAPKGLPDDVRRALLRGLRAALLEHDVMSRLEAMGAEVVATSSHPFARVLADERSRWRSLLLQTGRPYR